MSTKQALSHLQALIDLDERAGAQIRALAATLKQVNAQIAAILDDSDREIAETLTEESTGDEVEFRLGHTPVVPGSVKLYIDRKLVAGTLYEVEGADIIPVGKTPAGASIRAEYVVGGLKTQTAALLAQMDDLGEEYFIGRRAVFHQAIDWVEENFMRGGMSK